MKDASEEAMIDRREELNNVKCKSDAHISSGFKFQTS